MPLFELGFKNGLRLIEQLNTGGAIAAERSIIDNPGERVEEERVIILF
jgi:hypothetical protein